jgi:hypothetical protein
VPQLQYARIARLVCSGKQTSQAVTSHGMVRHAPVGMRLPIALLLTRKHQFGCPVEAQKPPHGPAKHLRVQVGQAC